MKTWNGARVQFAQWRIKRLQAALKSWIAYIKQWELRA